MHSSKPYRDVLAAAQSQPQMDATAHDAVRLTRPTLLRCSNNKPGETRMSSLSGKQGPRYRHIADESEPYETIGIEKLTPIIGAEISGVDIGKLVDDDEARSNRQM